MMAIAFPGPFELLILMVFIAAPIVVILALLRGMKRPAAPPAAFPVVTSAEADGPGSYRVVGVDRATRADRDVTIEAASRANAQVKAELDGMVVTSLTKA
jgi:hypothetical protein